MSDHSQFSAWLKRLRQERGLTQDALADQVGCATQTIRKIEGGSRRPSYQMATRLAQILQVPDAEHNTWMHAARDTPEAPPVSAPDEPLPHTPSRSLPTYLTPFVGRTHEAASVARLLHDPACRLLTILGPGGAGKTRLALQVAADIEARAGREVGFVALAPVMAATDVAAAIADALGCPLLATASVEESVLASLRDHELVLVLDNLEHVLGATAFLARLLREAPGLQLLVTSRERLRLQGEQVFDLPGLATPADNSSAAIERSDAVRLFVERARQIGGDAAPTPDDQAAIARICRLLDGMPLAIELAAAWVRTLSLDEIAAEIVRSLDFLTLSDRDAEQRHRSMRAVLDQSWALLSPHEQAVLARLSIVRGGCTREAAEAVAGATLPTLVAAVRTHPATSARTLARVDELWASLAAQLDAPTLAEAEHRASTTTPDQLSSLLAAYRNG